MRPNPNEINVTSDIIRVLIADQNAEVREKIQRMLAGHPRIRVTGLASSGADAKNLVKNFVPDCVVTDHFLGDMTGIDLAESVAKTSPGTVVLLYTDTISIDLSNRATSIGVKRVFTKPFSGGDIIAMIEDEVDKVRRAVAEQLGKIPLKEEGSGPFGFGKKKVEPTIRSIPRLTLAVMSAKGGVGKTTLSVNMAVAAASQGDFKPRVVLVDANEFPLVSYQLNLGSGNAEEDILQPEMVRNILTWEHLDENRYTPEELEDYMELHTPSGLWVIPGVPSPEKLAGVTPELMQKLIRVLNQNFDLVIIDMPPTISMNCAWAGAESVQKILIVTTPDPQLAPCTHQFNNVMNLLSTTHKCYKVVNRYDIGTGFSLADVDKYVPYTTIGMVPETPEVMNSIGRGQPYVLSDPDSEFAASVRSLLNQFYPIFSSEALVKESTPRQRKSGGSLFSRLFGGKAL